MLYRHKKGNRLQYAILYHHKKGFLWWYKITYWRRMLFCDDTILHIEDHCPFVTIQNYILKTMTLFVMIQNCILKSIALFVMTQNCILKSINFVSS
jgi:hypothetical protein